MGGAFLMSEVTLYQHVCRNVMRQAGCGSIDHSLVASITRGTPQEECGYLGAKGTGLK